MEIKDLKAILVIVCGLLVLYWIFEGVYLLYAATAVGLAALISARLGKGIVWLWFKIAQVLGYVNSRIILSAIFYLFLVPISTVYRLFQGDGLMLKRGSRQSTFHVRDHHYEPDDLKNPW